MTSLTRLQSTPGLTSVTKSAGPFVLPRDLSNEAGLIDIIDLRSLKRDRNKVTNVIFDDTGDAFACIDTAGHIVVFYVTKDRFVNVCNSVHPTATLITERNNGMLVVGLQDNSINVYNLGGKLLKQLKAHKYPVKSFAINDSRNLLLSQSQDACVLWDLSTFKIFKVLHSRHTSFTCAIFSPSEETLITGFQDSSIYFWNLETFQLDRRAFLPSDSKLMKMATSIEGNSLIAVGEIPVIHVFNLDHNQDHHHQSFQLPIECDSIKDMSFLPGKQLLILGGDGVLYCIDSTQDYQILFTKGLHGTKPIVSFASNPQGKFLLTVAETGEVFLYDFIKLLNIADRMSQKRSQAGIPAELAQQSLKPANTGQLYHQAFNSKPLGPREKMDHKGHTKNLSINDPYKEDKRYKENNYDSQKQYPLEIDSPLRSLEQKGEEKSPLDSLEEISDSFGPMHSPQSLSIDITQVTKPYLENFLHKHGIFPSKQRSQIWKYLLDLPINIKIYKSLQAKGTHPTFKDFFNQYPKSKLSEKVQEILSCLAHYCEAFSQIDYLPGLIFPFVRVFGEQEVLCFEIILSFLVNWGQHFLQNHPKPPIFLLQAIEKLLEYHEPYLYQHLKTLLEDGDGVGIGDILWNFVQNMLTDILKREDWLALMDFLVLNHTQPKYFLYFLVAYLSFLKDMLLKERDKDAILDIGYFVDKKSEVDIYKIFEKMSSYMEKTPVSAILISFQNNLPLPKGDYPSPEFFMPQLRNYYSRMEGYLVEAEKKRAERREQLQDVYKHLDEISSLSGKFSHKQTSLQEQRLKLKEEMRKDEEEKFKKKAELEEKNWNRRMAQIRKLEEDMLSCLEKQERIREEMWLEIEKERHLKNQIEEEKLKLEEEQEILRYKERDMVKRENELLGKRVEQEKERGDLLDQRREGIETNMKERLLNEKFKREEHPEKKWHNQDRKNQEGNSSREVSREYERKLNEGSEKFKAMNQEGSYDWERQNRRENKEDSKYDRHLESVEYSRDSNYKRGKTNEAKENMWEKRRNQIPSGEEANYLKSEFEENKRRPNELSFNDRNIENRKTFEDQQRWKQDRKLEDIGFGAEEQKQRREIEQGMHNRDKIEQENNDFERTLRETERRILEDDKLKYEQIREAWKEMNTTEDAPRGSTEEGRNRQFENSREGEGRDAFYGDRERLSAGNTNDKTMSRDFEKNETRKAEKRYEYDEGFNISREEEKSLNYRSNDERGSHKYESRNKSREGYLNDMPYKIDENNYKPRINYNDVRDQREDSREIEGIENPKEVRRRSIGERKSFGDS